MQKTIGIIGGGSLLVVILLWLLWSIGNGIEVVEMDIETVRAKYFEPLFPMSIGTVAVEASIARTPVERQRGLSHTPFLPPGVVKLFVFDESREWGFWMRDMNYPIDIIWLDESAQVVYIETDVHPDTHPETFTPDVPALYVIETEAGFVAEHDIQIGTTVDLPAAL